MDGAAVGLDKVRLDAAIAFAVARENPATRDLAVAIVDQFKAEAPYNTLIGPTQPRGASTGLVIRHGAVAARWGESGRADMTFSITKTFLSTVVGLAVDRGVIRSVTDRVGSYMPPGSTCSPRRTTRRSPGSTFCGRRATGRARSGASRTGPADRPPAGQTMAERVNRELHPPGTVYTYNDTRINVLALATLYVLKQPLPEVLKTSIMDPIGASSSWHWEGYDNA